jgi:hypothetical protein
VVNTDSSLHSKEKCEDVWILSSTSNIEFLEKVVDYRGTSIIWAHAEINIMGEQVCVTVKSIYLFRSYQTFR